MDLSLNALLYGFSIGIICYCVLICFVFLFLRRQAFLSREVFFWVLLAAIFHFIAGCCYWLMSIAFGSDSSKYFSAVDGVFRGEGTKFCMFMMVFLRQWLLHDSYLGAFLFSSALGFLGQLFFFLAFVNLTKKINSHVLHNLSFIRFPAFVILFWPSALYWSAGIAKDSITFFSIGLFFFAITSLNKNFFKLALIVFSMVCIYFVRPYLVMIIFLALEMWLLIDASIKAREKVLGTMLIGSAIIIMAPEMALIAHFNYTYKSIVWFIQNSLMGGEHGSYLDLGKLTSKKIILLLPLLMLVNAYFPLFVYAKNILAVISSLENIIFVWITIYAIRNRDVFKEIIQKNPVILFGIYFFLIGIFFLALLNVNFGLSMRRKIIYTMPILIVWGTIYMQKKITILQKRDEL